MDEATTGTISTTAMRRFSMDNVITALWNFVGINLKLSPSLLSNNLLFTVHTVA